MSTEARQLLAHPNTTPVALVAATKLLLGTNFLGWEPETIWLELERKGVSEVPVENRAKISAAVALHLVPAFFWDGVVTEKTALAFNNIEVNADVLQESSVERLTWAVRQAMQIMAQFGDPVPVFHHEPKAYAAVVCVRLGLVHAPTALSFCQDLLSSLTPNADGLRHQVVAAWNELDKSKLSEHPFKETELDVQLAHLAAVELYVRAQDAQAAEELGRLA